MNNRIINRRKTEFFVLLIVYVILAIIATSVGSASISPVEVVKTLLKSIPYVGNHIELNVPENQFLIILMIRLPRIIMASLVGIGLAVVGTSYQALFKNPLADPFVLGVSSGAALGATLAIVIKLPNSVISLSLVTIFAFIGAVVATLSVYLIAQVRGKVTTVNLLLAGCAVSFFMSAMIQIIMVFHREHINKIVFWMMGSFNASSWNDILIVAPTVIIGAFIIYFFYRDLNLMLIGDDTAKSLGVETEKLKKFIIIISSMVMAVCVSFSGIIGFVGFIVPQMVRILFGPNNKAIIPLSALGGAIFLLLSDTLARTVAIPAELPIGAVTAIIGSPYFIYLLINMKRRVW